MVNDLGDSSLVPIFVREISKSQFLILGEEHGYKENSEITDFFFKISMPLGYKYLCIETDSIAAGIIEQCAKAQDPLSLARKLDEDYPFSIPFYDSPDDYPLFKNVVSNGGNLWGIDQSFMTQFRLNLSQLNNITNNRSLRNELTNLEEAAHASFARAIENRDFRAPFIFQYSDSLHHSLLKMCESPSQKKILSMLHRSKEIYLYNFTNRQYLNNLHRSNLMKDNFLSYYRNSPESTPKVIFKLGMNHSGRGLNSTNVYDISNLLSELATVNGMTSTHIFLKGIKGNKSIANPFADVSTTSYDSTSKIPTEVLEVIKESSFKYYVIDLKPLRNQSRLYSDKLRKLMFQFDIIIFINDTMAKQTFD